MPRPLIELESIEGLHIGGQLRRLEGFPPSPAGHAGLGVRFDNNGLHMVGQMYAQHYRVARPRLPVPLALWHGGGMTGASWETTPDGRPGWLTFLLRQAFSVVLCDAFERGRASLPAFPQAFEGVPEYRSIESIWNHFRFGPPMPSRDAAPSEGWRHAAYAGQQFPIEHMEQFGRQFAPRFTNSDRATLAAYGDLLRRLGGCAIVGHSQGGVYAMQATLEQPDRVHAVIALEPPVTQACLQLLRQAGDQALPPHLFIFGDYIRGCSPTWEPLLDNAIAYCEALRRRGARAELIELPRLGIHGNSHILQMDANSERIAGIATEWLLSPR